jgi:hypothetical protein
MNISQLFFKVYTQPLDDRSKPNSLDKIDVVKISRNTVIVMISAGIVYLQPIFTSIDFGQYSYLAIPVISMLMDSLLKYLKDNR